MQFSIHKNFQLNGISFNNKKELLLFSKIISTIIATFLSDFLSDSDTLKVQTSGTTGIPKQLEIKKEFMINSALATGQFFDLQENTTALLCMNPTFIAGKMMLVRALVLGWKLDIVKPSVNPLQGIEKTYGFCAMVPMQVHHSLEDLYKIKKLIIGGGTVSKELESKLRNVKTAVFVTYGMTETVTHIAVREITNNELQIANYKTLSNVKISQDKRDCLVIDAPKVSESKIITNDLVKLISNTEFQWIGRYDTIINSGGIKLIPEQIEEKLAKIIQQRFFITSVPDKILGEKVVLVMEFKSLKSEKLKSSIFNEVKRLKSLFKYEIPKEIYFVEKFVETDTKKIQRKKTLDLILLK